MVVFFYVYNISMEIHRNRKIKGSMAATAVALFQGFEGLLFPLFGIIFTFTAFQSIGFSVGSLAVKEFLTFIIVLILMKPSKLIKVFKTLWYQKESRNFLWAGVIGTTLGNLFYIMAIQFAGSSYGVILTALYPVFSMIIIKLTMKTGKEGWRVWLGVTIAVLGAIAFVLVPAIVQGEDFGPLAIIGVVMGLLAALFWAFEGAFINIGVKKEVNKNISNNESVMIRSLGTNLVSFIVLLPLVAILSETVSGEMFEVNPYTDVIAKIFSSWEGILIAVIIAANLVILRIIHIYSISQIGAKLTAIIDTNNFLIPAFFSIFLVNIGLEFFHGSEPIYESIVWWSWLLLIPIMIGVFIVLFYNKGEDDEQHEILDIESTEEELEKDILLEKQL